MKTLFALVFVFTLQAPPVQINEVAVFNTMAQCHAVWNTITMPVDVGRVVCVTKTLALGENQK